MNKALSLISYKVVSPDVLLKAIVFPSIKKTKNKIHRESDVPIFNLKTGTYPTINQKFIKKLKKRR